MKQTLLAEYVFGEMRAVYLKDETGHVSMRLVPAYMQITPEDCLYSESLVQIRLAGDAACGGFASGLTMRGSETTEHLILTEQKVKVDGEVQQVITDLEDDRENGLCAEHILEYRQKGRGVRVFTQVSNIGERDLCMELLTTFSMVGQAIGEEDLREEPDRYQIHRFRSKWSAEGREETRSLQELLLERSWSSWGTFSERFGAIGSLPVRSYFPYVALEDRVTHTITAAMLGGACSWQMELFRRDANLCISGGIADYEFGHWRKVLRPGDRMRTPDAWLTCVRSTDVDLNDLAAQYLTQTYDEEAGTASPNLPVLFNEFCTSWGYPTQREIAALTEQLVGKGIRYFVIDAGWYADEQGNWQGNQGDWEVNEKQFPEGMKRAVEAVQRAGMRAGIWFEPEVIGPDAKIRSEEAHVLKRDGYPIISGERRFFDMREPWTRQYLQRKLIRYLGVNDFNYLKMDYNESIGVGCDSVTSKMDGPGEGLRQSIEASEDFFREIRKKVPDLAIEICASGGHRLVPEMVNLADYLSFSDAHEEKEIPLIAASLQRLVPPRKLQIWAVIRKTDDRQRIVYSLISAMYGVLCLSGDAFELSREQWDVIGEGIHFYRQISPVIVHGMTYYLSAQPGSFRTPERNYATMRVSTDGRKVLVIIHSFRLGKAEEIKITLPASGYRIVSRLEAGEHKADLQGGDLTVRMEESWDAAAYLLTQEKR